MPAGAWTHPSHQLGSGSRHLARLHVKASGFEADPCLQGQPSSVRQLHASGRLGSPAVLSPAISQGQAAATWHAGRPAARGPASGLHTKVMQDDAASSAAVMAEFPPAQHLFVAFLEAADSSRLQASITR